MADLSVNVPTKELKLDSIKVLESLKVKCRKLNALDKIQALNESIKHFDSINLGVISSHLKHAIRDSSFRGGTSRQIDTAISYLEVSAMLDEHEEEKAKVA